MQAGAPAIARTEFSKAGWTMNRAECGIIAYSAMTFNAIIASSPCPTTALPHRTSSRIHTSRRTAQTPSPPRSRYRIHISPTHGSSSLSAACGGEVVRDRLCKNSANMALRCRSPVSDVLSIGFRLGSAYLCAPSARQLSSGAFSPHAERNLQGSNLTAETAFPPDAAQPRRHLRGSAPPG